jgi:tetratricopeptide (TPR) repeat protein
MLRNLFGRKNQFDDAWKEKFVELIARALEQQKIVAGDVSSEGATDPHLVALRQEVLLRFGKSGASIEDEHGHPKRKALGYVYGFIDAALRTKGLDMADVSIGVPITYQVIRKLWPEKVSVYMDFLIKNMHSDALIAAGMMRGGEQYLDWIKPGAPGVPMGLAIFITEGDNPQPHAGTSIAERGLAFAEKGEYDRAIADFDEAIRLDPNDAHSFRYRGIAYYDKADYDRAIADFDEAIRLDPKDTKAYANRGFAYHVKGQHDRAIADIDEAIRLDPRNATFFAVRATMYIAKGDHDSAIGTCQ